MFKKKFTDLSISYSNKIIEDDDEKENPLIWMEKIYQQENINFRNLVDFDLVVILLDLILYKRTNLVNFSFELISKIFYQKQSLLKLINDVQILEDEEHIQSYKILKNINLELSNSSETTENWMGKEDNKSSEETIKTIQTLEKLTNFLVLDENNKKMFEEPEIEEIPNFKEDDHIRVNIYCK